MAEKRRILDVWIVESNTVYRAVPYTVVTDWVQQGRLLPDDRLRPAGTEQWFRLGDLPALAAYLPKAEPYRTEDRAEALEPVQVDFAWKRRPEDDEDDVDMIPLIDISLVLLIFFMMTAAVGTSFKIDTPEARFKLLSLSADSLWIGVKPGSNDLPEYSLGQGAQDKGETFASREELFGSLDRALKEHAGGTTGPAKITIRAHRRLPYEVVRELAAELERYKRRGQVVEILAEVSEKEGR